MATKKRANKVRPPRTPRGEPAKVTIANQSRQIELMINRVETLNKQLMDLVTDNQRLEKERDDQITMTNQIMESHKAEREIFDRAYVDLNNKVLAYTRLQGWQDCAREIFLPGGGESREFEPFPFSSAPGA